MQNDKSPARDRAPITQTKRGVAGLKGKKKMLHKLQNWPSQKRYDKRNTLVKAEPNNYWAGRY